MRSSQQYDRQYNRQYDRQAVLVLHDMAGSLQNFSLKQKRTPFQLHKEAEEAKKKADFRFKIIIFIYFIE